MKCTARYMEYFAVVLTCLAKAISVMAGNHREKPDIIKWNNPGGKKRDLINIYLDILYSFNNYCTSTE